MKKKGFTMIEVIVSLSIILIIFSCSISKNSFDKNIYEDIEDNGFIYEVHDFITYSRLKCIKEKKRGEIVISPSDNKIYFKIGTSQDMEFLKLPSGIKIASGRNIIPLSNNGRLNKADTIVFQNSFNELRKITIRVGVDYISLDGK